MKYSVELRYYKEYKQYLQTHRLEREESDQAIEPDDIAADVREQIEQIMQQRNVSGKITITIEVGE